MMSTGKRFGLISGLAMAAWACTEDISAPGACPAFCPAGDVQMVDTVLTTVVERDSSFRGYVTPHQAFRLQVTGGGAVESRGVLRFQRFGSIGFIDSTTTNAPVVGIDSFELSLEMSRRNLDVPVVEVRMHYLPITVDSTTTFDELEPFFDDSTLVGTMAIADTIAADTAISVLVSGVFPGDALPRFETDDSLQAAIGLSIAGTPGFITMGTIESQQPAKLTRYIQLDSAGVATAARTDERFVEFDGFVAPDPAPAVDEVLAVGGAPSSRALLRFALPSFIIDSSRVVGATLLLVPIEPSVGAPTDSFAIVANALSGDFGPKSPLIPVADPADLLGTAVLVGGTDTVAIDISSIVALWQSDPDQRRSLMLRARSEASTLAEIRIGSSRMPGLAPAVRLTFVPPFDFVSR